MRDQGRTVHEVYVQEISVLMNVRALTVQYDIQYHTYIPAAANSFVSQKKDGEIQIVPTLTI